MSDNKPTEIITYELTEEEKNKRRKRNLAIAWGLAFFMALFYCITLFKIGPAIFKK